MTRTAVVTGASSGIGAATAKRLSKDGYDVVLAARRIDRLEILARETGGRAVALDVTDSASVARLAVDVGHCDALVNCAGGAVGAETVATSDSADWRRSFELNVIGTLNVIRALLPQLNACPTADIVTITSTAAHLNYETAGSYSAAKHAQHALMQTLRLELCGQPIRVVEIAPGMVQTEEFSLNRFRGDAEKAAAVYANVDRPLVAEDVAECVAWVLSLPFHVNIDQLVVRPVAQAGQHRVHRGPLFESPSPPHDFLREGDANR